VAEAIEYEQFEDGATNGAEPSGEADLARLSAIPMELSVEIGRAHMTVGETLDLGVGSVVTLERLAGETADLLVNGSAIARGEVVVVDEQYGLRLTEILDREDDDEAAPSLNGSAPADAAGESESDEAAQEAAAEPAAQTAAAEGDGGEEPAEG
jgi:flagellar motor switch protein FliN